MRRLLVFAAVGLAVYLVVARRRASGAVTVAYADGSSLTLADDTAGVEAIRAAASGVLRA